VLIERNIDGAYDRRVLLPDSVTVLERDSFDPSVVVQAVPPPASAHKEGLLIHEGLGAASLVGSIEQWGTSVADFSYYRVEGPDRSGLPLDLTVLVRYGTLERAQRLRFVPALDRPSVRRIPDTDGKPSSRIAIECHVVFLPSISRAYVEVLEAESPFTTLSVELGGEVLREPDSKPVRDVRIGVVGEYLGAPNTLHARLWVVTATGERYGLTWPVP
jgi:hypothetical protein